jgi:DNA-binding NtrC family response regulator
MGLLLKHDFPGNIRELENILEHCFILCQGDVIEKKHLPDSLKQQPGEESQIDSEQMTLKQAEEVMIRQALKRNSGNKTAAAKQLGINPSTLFRKLKNLGIND